VPDPKPSSISGQIRERAGKAGEQPGPRQGVLLVFALAAASGIFLYRDYLFFERAFVFDGFACDTITQFFPITYFWITRVLAGDFSPWSFQLDMGTNVYGLLLNLNPFDLPLILFGPQGFTDALPFINLCKHLAAALLFYAFLCRLGIDRRAAVCAALCYAFSGYMLINGHWYHYPNYAVFLALLLCLFERWLQTGRWLAFVLVLGFVQLKGELQLFQAGLFFAGYIPFRLASRPSFAWSKLVKVYCLFGVLYLLGMLVNGYALLPSVLNITESGRGGEVMGRFSLLAGFLHFLALQDGEGMFSILARFLSSDMLGSFAAYQGKANYFEGPAVYMGLLPLVLLPCFLVLAARQGQWRFPLFALFGMIPLFFPNIREFANGMASSTFKYITLYSITVLLIVFAHGLDTLFRNAGRLRLQLFGSTIAWMVIFLAVYAASFPHSRDGAGLLPLGMLLLWASVWLVPSGRPAAGYLGPVIMTALAVELVLAGSITMSGQPGALKPGFIQRGENYFDPGVNAALARVREDGGFFRVERNFYSGGLNDALVQGYYGTSSYFGFVRPGIIDFYRTMELSEDSPRLDSYRYGLERREELHSLLAVKYFLSRDASGPPDGYRLDERVGGVSVYRNDRWMPPGSLCTAQVPRKDFDGLDRAAKDRLLLSACVVESAFPDIPLIPGAGARLEGPGSGTLQTNIFFPEEFGGERIAGRASVPAAGILFFPVPYDRGWQAKVNGRAAELSRINIGFAGLALPAGEHAVELRYMPPFSRAGWYVSLFAVLMVSLLYWRYPEIRVGKADA
jgi:uncharacterized membrane protein YfhO